MVLNLVSNNKWNKLIPVMHIISPISKLNAMDIPPNM